MILVKNRKHKFVTDTSASVTVESIIVFPFFVMFFLLFVFIGKSVYAYEQIQFSLEQSVQSLSSYAYIYYKSGLSQKESDKIQNPGSFSDITGTLLNSDNKPGTLQNVITNFLLYKGTQEIKTAVAIPFVKSFINNSGVANSDNFNFNGTDILSEGKGDIFVKVAYSMKVPFFSSILPDIRFTNTAVAKPWLGGDETVYDSDDIWSLPPFSRGKKLQKILGENLPDGLPISIQDESGQATRITSIDLTLPTASQSSYISDTVASHIKALKGFSGTDSDELSIGSGQITSRKLIVVIPEGVITEEQRALFDALKSEYSAQGLTLEIKEYGKKTAPIAKEGNVN